MNQIMKQTETQRLVVRARQEAGKVGWALLWLLGVPLPVLLIIYLIRGH